MGTRYDRLDPIVFHRYFDQPFVAESGCQSQTTSVGSRYDFDYWGFGSGRMMMISGRIGRSLSITRGARPRGSHALATVRQGPSPG